LSPTTGPAVRSAVVVVAPAAPFAFADQLSGDAGPVRAAGADYFDGLGVRSWIGFRREDGRDHDAFELEVGLGLKDVARFGPFEQEAAFQHALRFPCARGAPRPGAVGARASQFNLDSAGHASKLQEDGVGRTSRFEV
jgi:hypothetical protein